MEFSSYILSFVYYYGTCRDRQDSLIRKLAATLRSDRYPSATPMNIRSAQIEDADRIAILSKQLGYSPTPQEVRQRLETLTSNSTHGIYVATLDTNEAVGWVHAYRCELIIIPQTAIIFGLVVDEQYRRQGIGRQLMKRIEQCPKGKRTSLSRGFTTF